MGAKKRPGVGWTPGLKDLAVGGLRQVSAVDNLPPAYFHQPFGGPHENKNSVSNYFHCIFLRRGRR
jgi:hypothetical protein